MDFLFNNYWSKRYEENETTWDIGYVSPALKNYFDQLKNKNLRILIPGCGNAYEAKYLFENGFTNITLIDISPVLTERLQKTFPPESNSIRILTGDFFEMNGEFDLIIEQTFFCAIDPSLRQQYVKKMSSLLSGNGKLAGLLFNREFVSGPPFGGSEKEYRQLFSSSFRIKILETCNNSIPARAGTELFLLAEKK